MDSYDIVIIGAGVSGCAIARELARFDTRICVVEGRDDVCSGTSKANSAIIHAGYDAVPGTLKAKLNVEGNLRMEELSSQLDFKFRRNGSLVLCFDKDDMFKLTELYERGLKNNVTDMQILSGEEVRRLEPNVSDEVTGALYAPTAAIICPFGLNIALAENAAENGVDFRFNTHVNMIRRERQGYVIETGKGEFRAECVVNAAGVYADTLHNMVSKRKLHITARRGDYMLLDKMAGEHVSHTIFTLPGPRGKGIITAPTIHGNLIIGPTAIDVEDKEAVNTTGEALKEVALRVNNNLKSVPLKQVITSFSGLRAHEDGGDFIIGEAEDAENFFDCTGIESPGLSACPAIGEKVAKMVADKLKLKKKTGFKATRKGMINPAELSTEERNRLIKEQPAYGNIVCRCEMISEGEILDAIHRPLGAVSMDGIKRRTRAGMGRCQSGFCTPRTMEILARELNISMTEITKKGGESKLLTEDNRKYY